MQAEAVTAAENPPPGRGLHELDAEAQRLALVGLEGLAAQLRARQDAARAGSSAYHDLGQLIGRVSTVAAVLRRHVMALENARAE